MEIFFAKLDPDKYLVNAKKMYENEVKNNEKIDSQGLPIFLISHRSPPATIRRMHSAFLFRQETLIRSPLS